MNHQSLINELEGLLKNQPPAAAIELLSKQFNGKIVFSTSFGLEDQAISHLIFQQQLPVEVFTLDTGRMFTETYSTWSKTVEKYKQPIFAYYPNETELQQFVSGKGPNSFYESVDNRKQCCYIRKVEPLKRALHGKEVWITGLRAEQSPNRKNIPQLEWDEANNIIKFHPLLYWSLDETYAFIQQNHIPYNVLFDKGFVSIGCAPCTRAIKPGEDFRAGRWWWEDSSKKECGLHVHSEETPSAFANTDGGGN
jgi:phosphoadenosine phosphosulfate reductase